MRRCCLRRDRRGGGSRHRGAPGDAVPAARRRGPRALLAQQSERDRARGPAPCRATCRDRMALDQPVHGPGCLRHDDHGGLDVRDARDIGRRASPPPQVEQLRGADDDAQRCPEALQDQTGARGSENDEGSARRQRDEGGGAIAWRPRQRQEPPQGAAGQDGLHGTERDEQPVLHGDAEAQPEHVRCEGEPGRSRGQARDATSDDSAEELRQRLDRVPGGAHDERCQGNARPVHDRTLAADRSPQLHPRGLGVGVEDRAVDEEGRPAADTSSVCDEGPTAGARRDQTRMSGGPHGSAPGHQQRAGRAAFPESEKDDAGCSRSR